MLPCARAEIRYYVDANDRAPFADWVRALDDFAAFRVAGALKRMAEGNFSNAKGVGKGVLEFRIDFGPGYRIYFGRDGDAIVVLLTGGTKDRQQRDILAAQALWLDYKQTKRSQH